MPKRIYKSKFKFYVILSSIPFFLSGILFLFYPGSILMKTGSPADPFFILIFRITGITGFYISITLLYIMNRPNEHRDLILFQSLLFISLTIVIGAGVYMKILSIYLISLAIYFLFSGIFLLSFATKNLLVKD